MTIFELVYVLFWLDLSIICLLLLFFEQEIKEIYFLLTLKRRNSVYLDTPMLRNLMEYLENTSPEQVKKDFEEVRSKGLQGPSAKEFIKSFKDTPVWNRK